MGGDATEVVRLGVGHARITGISRERVEYINEAGQQLSIDLAECAERWPRYKQSLSHNWVPTHPAVKSNMREVGDRDTSASPPWARFANERRTKFEFVGRSNPHADLLRPLLRFGYWLFDWT